jgi:predicted MFS family arabinose efflux permease
MLGFGTYLLHNTLQTNATQMAPATRGSALALFAFCFFNGQAIGVSLAGTAYDRGGPMPLLVAPALVLPVLGWTFAGALRRRAAH